MPFFELFLSLALTTLFYILYNTYLNLLSICNIFLAVSYDLLLYSLMCFFHAVQANSLSRETNWLSCLAGYKSVQIWSRQWGVRDPVRSTVKTLPRLLWQSSLFLLNWIKREKESSSQKAQIREGSLSYLMWCPVKRRTYSLMVCSVYSRPDYRLSPNRHAHPGWCKS